MKLKHLAASIAALFAAGGGEDALAKRLGSHQMSDNTPGVADLQKYRVNRAGQPEVIRQSLYDFMLYPTAGQTQLLFYSTPKGQGAGANGTTSTGAAAGTAKSFADTNMTLGGQLPRFQNYLAESLEVRIEPGSVSTANTFTIQNLGLFHATSVTTSTAAANDVWELQQTGWVELFIGAKTYLQEAPIGRFPPKCRAELDGGLASNSATTGVYSTLVARAGGRPYYLQPRVVLTDSQNFAVTLNWPVAVATPSGFNARVGVVLDGFLYRASQ
jgi:hypothetical protein